jgi:hypothetical protein
MTAEARANAILGDSIVALEQKVNLYSLALRNAVIGSEDYNRIQRLLSQAQRELSEAMSEGRQEVDQAVNAYRQLTQAISAARTQMEHLVAVGDFDQAKAVNATVKALEGQKLVMDGIIEHGGDVHAFLNSLTDDTVALMEEIDEANINFLETFAESAERLAQERENQRIDEIRAEEDARRFRLEREEWENQMRIRMAEERARAIQQVTDATLAESFNLYSMYAYARQDREISELHARRDRELANENLTEEERLRIQERYRSEEAKIKEDAWKRQRNADIVESLISGALAVSRALAAPPGFPWNAASVTAAAALAAIQTAAIAAQPVPQFFEGRYATVRGEKDNKLYRAELAGQPRTGIYKRPALISETGGELIIDAPTTRHLQLNYPEIIQGIMANRVPQYASGRYPAQSTSPQRREGAAADAGQDVDNEIMEETIDMLRQNIATLVMLRDIIQNHGIKATVELFEIRKANDDLDNIESETGY